MPNRGGAPSETMVSELTIGAVTLLTWIKGMTGFMSRQVGVYFDVDGNQIDEAGPDLATGKITHYDDDGLVIGRDYIIGPAHPGYSDRGGSWQGQSSNNGPETSSSDPAGGGPD